MTAPPPLRFALLGAPVRVDCANRALRDRLALCYAAAVAEAGAEDPVRARVDEDASSFTIRADGRDAVRVDRSDFATAVRTTNHELMHALMRRQRHLFYIHAGVVAFDGAAVVLPGLSCAGKSTLVLALLQCGGKFLSDELLAYDPASGLAVPFPRAVKIRDHCVAYFPAFAQRFVGSGEARFLPLAELGADALADAARVRRIVAPRWDAHGDNDLRAITPGEAVLDLVQSTLNFGSQRNASIDHLSELANGAASYTLRWSDPTAAAAAIMHSLRQPT